MPKLNLDKVNRFMKRKNAERAAKIREGYYSHLDPPRLEHVYKNRSIESSLEFSLKPVSLSAALELGIKPFKSHPKELWNWKD